METISSDNLPMVSVWMITYNHEKFIAKAIESVLMQQRKFKIEIVIGDDNSSDDTSKIILNYQNQYPDIIRARVNTTNKGMMSNMIETLSECKGKYIALLEGDDYWTFPSKLQTQVDFLESHPAYSFTFHNALVVYDNDIKDSHPHAKLSNGDYSGNSIISNWIVPTASVVFRNSPIYWPPFSYNFVHGDIFLFLLLLENGKASCINKEWCVYRKNENSVTLTNSVNSSFIRKIISQVKTTDQFFNKKYHKELVANIVYWRLALSSILLKEKKLFEYGIQTINFIFNHPMQFFSRAMKKLKGS